MLDHSRRFLLPSNNKMKTLCKEYRGYMPLYAENLDPASDAGDDSKESYYVGPLKDLESLMIPNQCDL